MKEHVAARSGHARRINSRQHPGAIGPGVGVGGGGGWGGGEWSDLEPAGSAPLRSYLDGTWKSPPDTKGANPIFPSICQRDEEVRRSEGSGHRRPAYNKGKVWEKTVPRSRLA